MEFLSNSPSKILIIFVSCLAFQTFFSTELSLANAAGLIDDVCSHVPIDPQFCKTAFDSDPRSRMANIPALAQIGIDLAQSHTKSSIALLNSLKQRATDPKLKGIFDSCLENYNDSSESLTDCTAALKERDFPTLNIRASAALDGPDTCDDNFSESPASEPQQLKQSSKQVQALCSAIGYISNKLQGPQ